MDEPLVFFGSGPVAAASLDLLAQDFTIEAVVTKPKPAHHRGDFPVISLAEQRSLPLHYAATKAELDQLFATKPFSSRLGVVIDYGVIISRAVIDYFPLGIINSHFSLLPEWRGADPITFSILSGQTKTGVSLMLINEKLDEGDLLAQADYDLSADATTPSLTADLIELSHHSLKTILPLYTKGETFPAPQASVSIAASKEPTYSRKLTKTDGLLDPGKPAVQLEREIRAFIEWPKSQLTIADKPVVVIKAHVDPEKTDHAVGKVFKTAQKTIGLQTADGVLVIEQLRPAGKPTMSAEAFLAGNPL